MVLVGAQRPRHASALSPIDLLGTALGMQERMLNEKGVSTVHCKFRTSNPNAYMCSPSAALGLQDGASLVTGISGIRADGHLGCGESTDADPTHYGVSEEVSTACPAGKVISCFLFMSYGRTQGSCAGLRGYDVTSVDGACSFDESDDDAVVHPPVAFGTECIGKRQCSLTVFSTGFGTEPGPRTMHRSQCSQCTVHP